jgi:hypothetical protein
MDFLLTPAYHLLFVSINLIIYPIVTQFILNVSPSVLIAFGFSSFLFFGPLQLLGPLLLSLELIITFPSIFLSSISSTTLFSAITYFSSQPLIELS